LVMLLMVLIAMWIVMVVSVRVPITSESFLRDESQFL